MLVGGALGATVVANVFAASSPSPSPVASPGTFKSNEDPTHEKGESAAQEAAENNGTFHPAGGPGGGPSNESPAHEATESPSREASEKS